MPTLILTPRYSEDSQALWRAAVSLDWDVERLVKWQIPPHLLSVTEPVLYLEGLMAQTIARQFKLQLIEPTKDWLPILPQQYSKRWIELQTLAEAKNLTTPAFIKPPNDKSFPAKIYTGQQLPDGYGDETPVLVAEIVEWEKEFRCFILNRTLKTFSVYLRNGVLQHNSYTHSQKEEKELLNFVNRILADDDITLPIATVLDVGVIKDRGWAVVELNAAWGSGIYGCDPIEVLKVLRHSIVKL